MVTIGITGLLRAWYINVPFSSSMSPLPINVRQNSGLVLKSGSWGLKQVAIPPTVAPHRGVLPLQHLVRREASAGEITRSCNLGDGSEPALRRFVMACMCVTTYRNTTWTIYCSIIWETRASWAGEVMVNVIMMKCTTLEKLSVMTKMAVSVLYMTRYV